MSMATAAAGSRHLRSGEATPSKLGPDPIAASGPVPRHRSAESMGVGAQAVVGSRFRQIGHRLASA